MAPHQPAAAGWDQVRVRVIRVGVMVRVRVRVWFGSSVDYRRFIPILSP